MTDVAGRARDAVALRIRTARLPTVGEPPPPDSRAVYTVAVAVLAGVAAVVAGKVLLPNGLPNGIIVLGLVLGGLNALPALAIVLVYRANRIINFSQGELGAFAASLAYLLIQTLHWSWYVAVPTGLAASLLMGGFIEFAIMRRFFAAPRLLATVATIGIAQLLTGFRLGLPQLFPDLPGFAGTFPSALGGHAFTLSGAIFSWDTVLIIVVVPVATVAVAAFLRQSWAGLGTRAAAGNVDRSRLLGIPVRRLSTIVWATAGLLSGLTSVLKAPVTGFSLIAASGTGLMTRILTPAAIGGFTNLPLTFVAALGLGVVEQAFVWNYARGGPIETVQLGILLVALLVRSRGLRAFDQADQSMSWVAVREMARVPGRLLRRQEVRLAGLVGAFIGVQLLLAAPQLVSPGKVSLIGLIGIHLIAGLSLIVLTGWAGQVSLGHWALVGVGAFVAGNLTVRWGVDFFVAIGLATVVGGLVALLLGIPAQRMPGMMFGVTTLAFAVASQNWLFQLDWVTRGANPARPILLGRIDLSSTNAFYYFTMAATLVALLAVWNMKRYRLADVLLSTRDNPRAAEAFGVSVASARRLAFFLSGCLAGFAGALYAFHQQVVASNRFGPELGPSILAMVVIGGLGSIPGVVIGAILIRGAQYLLPAWASFFTTGIGLLIVLLVFPGGLGEVVLRLRDRAVGWLVGERQPIDRRDVTDEEPLPVGAAAAVAS